MDHIVVQTFAGGSLALEKKPPDLRSSISEISAPSPREWRSIVQCYLIGCFTAPGKPIIRVTSQNDQVKQMRLNRSRLSRLLKAVPRPLATPFTFWYLVLLGITTLVQHVASPATVNRLLMHSSTDPHNLWQRPLQTLLTSAFWIVDARWIVYAIFFTLVLAPLERRIGSWWTFAIFLSGHVVATLATEVPVSLAKYAGAVGRAETHWLDIGVSYGFFTAAGVLLMMLAPPARKWGILVFETGIILLYISGQPDNLLDIVTVCGHLIALHFGMFAWLPWSRHRNFVGSINPHWPSSVTLARKKKETVAVNASAPNEPLNPTNG
jgi:hypothetical protein